MSQYLDNIGSYFKGSNAENINILKNSENGVQALIDKGYDLNQISKIAKLAFKDYVKPEQRKKIIEQLKTATSSKEVEKRASKSFNETIFKLEQIHDTQSDVDLIEQSKAELKRLVAIFNRCKNDKDPSGTKKEVFKKLKELTEKVDNEIINSESKIYKDFVDAWAKQMPKIGDQIAKDEKRIIKDSQNALSLLLSKLYEVKTNKERKSILKSAEEIYKVLDTNIELTKDNEYKNLKKDLNKYVIQELRNWIYKDDIELTKAASAAFEEVKNNLRDVSDYELCLANIEEIQKHYEEHLKEKDEPEFIEFNEKLKLYIEELKKGLKQRQAVTIYNEIVNSKNVKYLKDKIRELNQLEENAAKIGNDRLVGLIKTYKIGLHNKFRNYKELEKQIG